MPDRRTVAGLPLLMPLLSACTPLGVLNTVVPKDTQSTLAVRDLAYGPDPRQRLDIYLPKRLEAPPPLLMFVYGGSWRSGRKESYGFVGRAFAARGFATAIPDYRLVPEVRFPDFVVDCGKAFKAFRSAARSRTGSSGPCFLAGHSAGAYNAVMLALDDDIARQAGYPRHTIAGVAGISGPYDFLPLRVRATKEAFAGVDDLERTQPVNLAGPEAPPMLLLTSSDDTAVLPENADRLAERLRDAGASAEVRRYDGLGHAGTLVALARPFRSKADILDDITGYFDEIARTARPSRAVRPQAVVATGVTTG